MKSSSMVMSSGRGPLPLQYLRHVRAVALDVLAVLDTLVVHLLFQIGRLGTQRQHAIDDIRHQMKPVEVVAYYHVEWRRGRAFFLVAAHMQVLVIGAAIREPVNEPRVTVAGEDDRPFGGGEPPANPRPAAPRRR